MSQSKKKQIFLIFENNRIETHNKDGSLLQIRKDKVMYISPKGIKNILSIEQIYRSPDLCNKINAAYQKFNLFSNQHSYYEVFFQSNKGEVKKQHRQYLKMSMKVNEFRWQNPEVQQTKDGYKISSDCRLASLTLKKDLYTIQIDYLQYTRSSNTYIQKIPNMTKLLLQKYNYSYTQFPKVNMQKQNPQYHYVKNKKIFSIFNINNQWKYPLHLVWNSLISHQVIPQQFCYIQYCSSQMNSKTSMPEIKNTSQLISDQSNRIQQKQKQMAVIPILGKINHKDKCLFMKIDDCLAWFQNQKQNSFLFDSYGFWFYNYNTLIYRTMNKIQNDRQFHPKALPYILRFNNQPQRSVLIETKLFIDYLLENRKISQFNELQLKFKKASSKFDNQNNLIKEELNPQLGEFKAFSNGTIIAKFFDRSLLTLNSKKMQVKIIKKNGQTCLIDLSNTQSVNFQDNKQYISWAVDFQERVFFIDEWMRKQERNNHIEQLLQNIQTLQKTSQTYLKMCKNSKNLNNKLIQ